jgi:hypothetical protein
MVIGHFVQSEVERFALSLRAICTAVSLNNSLTSINGEKSDGNNDSVLSEEYLLLFIITILMRLPGQRATNIG